MHEPTTAASNHAGPAGTGEPIPRAGSDAPRVSVIIATFNGAAHVEKSLRSVLDQTMEDFEVVVVDDCSTDGTPNLVRGMGDHRIRLAANEANEGVVASRNRCLSLARGAYVAMLDHDDLSLPTRLERQADYLDAHGETVLVGTAAHTLEAGRMGPAKLKGPTTPELIGWMLLLSNPLVCSSVMFRAEAARRLGGLMRPDYAYADDFDLYHRMAAHGRIARVDETLTVYRLHERNASRLHEEAMTANAAKVLAAAYSTTFASAAEAREAATLVALHVSCGRPVRDIATLVRLRGIVKAITEAYAWREGLDRRTADGLRDRADALWRRVADSAGRGGLRGISEGERTLYRPLPSPASAIARQAAARLPFRKQAKSALAAAARALEPAPPRPATACGTDFVPEAFGATEPPALYVIVDTEAQFDWGRPLSRDSRDVSAIRSVHRGQEILDRHGIRPIYVVDHAVATDPLSVATLRAMLDDGRCAIGAHLHPWNTPPYAEALGAGNSFPGNLPADVERAKVRSLALAIAEGFGHRPQFYKAGRYGFGPNTAAILEEEGFKVDLSIMPGTDLRGIGGPDMTGLEAIPYRMGDGGMLSLPMTRATIGALPALSRMASVADAARLVRRLRVRALLARAGAADTVTLTPEGMTAEEQERLLRRLYQKGRRQFALHFHSPSLQPGNTPYVRTEEDLDAFLARLARVCRFFVEDLGGMPGTPGSLLRQASAPG